MHEQNLQGIREFLQDKDAQERIRRSMKDARSKATVTISRAASLFNFSESQLREWEKRGLLKTERPSISQDGKTGHRQYTPTELDKLAIIRELINGGYSPGDIPQNFDTIWEQIVHEQPDLASSIKSIDTGPIRETQHVLIDEHLERADQEAFWRYFISQALRLSLMLLCEDMPDTIAGLIIPLQQTNASKMVHSPYDLPGLGTSLIGWLGQNRTFYTFLDPAPEFEYPSDFRIELLRGETSNLSGASIVQNNTLIIVQRRAPQLPFNPALAETICRLLEPIYANVDKWQPSFGYGMRDWVYPATDFTSNLNLSDGVLDGLADMVVQLGGKGADGLDRWRFCCILVPKDTALALQQRSLVVWAQSKYAPHKVGVTSVSLSPNKHIDSLSLKAYQSGHIIYRPETSPKDSMVALGTEEGDFRSAIAIPVGGEDGLSTAVMYVVSDVVNAFSLEDQRVLRMIGRMVEELVITYRARQQVSGKLADWITTPEVVDRSFREFLSETEFISDVEALLTDIAAQEITEEVAGQDVSFIAIDIDNQTALATKYGDQVARNLSRSVGLRILGQLRLFDSLKSGRLYHVYADRYYLLLKGMPLEEARNKAEQLRVALKGEYRIDARRATAGRPILPGSLLELPDVTVRLGVTSYKYWKLKEVLGRYTPETAVADVRKVITDPLDEVLEKGQREGGKVIISWDHEIWGYITWSPSQ